MYDPALSFWSINSTGLLHPSCRPLWPPRISSAALAERLLWLGVEVRGWWDLLLMLWCVVNTFNYCCHCSWWLNGLPMGVPLGFMISETNGGPFEVIGIYLYNYIYIHIYIYIYILSTINPTFPQVLWTPPRDSTRKRSAAGETKCLRRQRTSLFAKNGRFSWDLIWLVDWTPLKNMKVNWDDHSQSMGK